MITRSLEKLSWDKLNKDRLPSIGELRLKWEQGELPFEDKWLWSCSSHPDGSMYVWILNADCGSVGIGSCFDHEQHYVLKNL